MLFKMPSLQVSAEAVSSEFSTWNPWQEVHDLRAQNESKVTSDHNTCNTCVLCLLSSSTHVTYAFCLHQLLHTKPSAGKPIFPSLSKH